MNRPKNQQAAAELGAVLMELREALPLTERAYEQIGRVIHARFDVDLRKEQVRKYHIGEVDPTNADAEQLLALVRFYDVPESRLGFIAARRIRAARELFVTWTPPTDGGPVSGEPEFACISTLSEFRPKLPHARRHAA